MLFENGALEFDVPSTSRFFKWRILPVTISVSDVVYR